MHRQLGALSRRAAHAATAAHAAHAAAACGVMVARLVLLKLLEFLLAARRRRRERHLGVQRGGHLARVRRQAALQPRHLDARALQSALLLVLWCSTAAARADVNARSPLYFGLVV